jgi:quinol monooxygenase YgiN
MSRVTLKGLIRVPPDRLDAVLAELGAHIRLTREEEGCLVFRVDQRSNEPSVLDVYEEFVDRASFDAHQARVKESRWGACTKNLVREYTITDASKPTMP